MSRYIDATLDTLRAGDTKQLGLDGYVAAGCCPLIGTTQCANCPLWETIPLENCSPPDDCPKCEQRDGCPCGNDGNRQALLARMAEATTRHSVCV